MLLFDGHINGMTQKLNNGIHKRLLDVDGAWLVGGKREHNVLVVTHI